MAYAFGTRAFLAVFFALSGLTPLVATGSDAINQRDLDVPTADGRLVSTRIFAPADGCHDCALVIFSHGAYSTYDRYDRLLLAWARAGLVVAAPLHVDSEAHPDREDYPQDAALPARVDDYLALLNLLSEKDRLQAMGIELSGEVVAAGHSFGALIAQIAAGANPPTVSPEVIDALAAQAPAAVVAISPPPAMEGYIELAHWSRITVPMLVVTGTADVIPNFVTDWRQHLLSYEAAPDAHSYALVFDDVDHYFNGAFGRPTPAGESMGAVMDDLNGSIVGFIHAVQSGRSPTDMSWWVALPDSVRPLSHGEMPDDE